MATSFVFPGTSFDTKASGPSFVDRPQVGSGALSPKSAIVLMSAMSVHSLFETMALGLANDRTSAVMMAASIGLHQPAESIALLVAFLKTSMPRPQVRRNTGSNSNTRC